MEVDEEVKEEEKGFANYIRMGDQHMPCKICPNPDRHRTFNCPNLTPGLKETLKESRSKFGHVKAYDPDIKRCDICEKRDHWSHSCPYLFVYPGGAHVIKFVEFKCLCCDEIDAHPGRPGIDWEARCILTSYSEMTT